MRLKKGDIVKIKNPIPNENPNHLYVVVQQCIEWYKETQEIHCMLLDSNFFYPPISRIKMFDLEVVGFINTLDK